MLCWSYNVVVVISSPHFLSVSLLSLLFFFSFFFSAHQHRWRTDTQTDRHADRLTADVLLTARARSERRKKNEKASSIEAACTHACSVQQIFRGKERAVVACTIRIAECCGGSLWHSEQTDFLSFFQFQFLWLFGWMLIWGKGGNILRFMLLKRLLFLASISQCLSGQVFS